jgi:hypothetical protein
MRITAGKASIEMYQQNYEDVHSVVAETTGDWLKLKVQIMNRSMDILIDNGSSISFITTSLVRSLGLVAQRRTSLLVKTINDKQSTIYNVYQLSVKIIKSGVTATLHLHETTNLPENYEIMLGQDALRAFKAKLELSIDDQKESSNKKGFETKHVKEK